MAWLATPMVLSGGPDTGSEQQFEGVETPYKAQATAPAKAPVPTQRGPR